jgi:hypothetical protein
MPYPGQGELFNSTPYNRRVQVEQVFQRNKTDLSELTPAHREFLFNTLAKSRVPVDHLEDIQKVGRNPGDGKLGVYTSKDTTIRMHFPGDMGKRQIPIPNHVLAHTLVHEVGHHADYIALGDSRRTFSQSPAPAGVDPRAHYNGIKEGVADHYMVQRMGAATTTGTAHGQSYRGRGERASRTSGYAAAYPFTTPSSTPTLNNQQFSQDTLF